MVVIKVSDWSKWECKKLHPDISKTVGGDRFLVKRKLRKIETEIMAVKILLKKPEKNRKLQYYLKH